MRCLLRVMTTPHILIKLNSSLNTPNNDMNTDHSIDTISAPSPIIPRIKVFGNSPSPEEIRDNYIAKNLPFILTGDACLSTNSIPWKVFDEWLVCSENGQVSQLDVEHIIRHYGEDVVPVADCSKQEYGAHPKTEMKFTEFLSRMGGGDCCLYLKDYHFVRMHEDVKLYETPAYFTSDWLNEYCVDKGKDDYRFVYLGSTGSWTPFHADVLHSFSWSANVVGKKRWILYPPGKEELMRDQLGNLPFDVTIEPYTLPTHPSYPHRVEVTQSSREIIFVPSGWHHQVHNLETTLSVNHNWFNGCNAEKCWNYLKYNLQLVEKEISEFKDSMTDWESHCQVLLRAHMGFHFEDFIEILIHIANKRLGMNRPQVFDLVALRDMFRQIANVNSSRRTTIETLVKEINKTLQYYI